MKRFVGWMLFLVVSTAGVGWSCTEPINEEKVAEKTSRETLQEKPPADVNAEIRPEPKVEPRPEPMPEPRSEPRPEPRVEPTSELRPEPRSEPMPEPVSDAGEPTMEKVTPDAGPDQGPDLGPDGNSSDRKVIPDAPKPTFTLQGTLVYFLQAKQPAAAGVSVCVYQRPSISCDTTDSKGGFRLQGLPQRTALYVTFSSKKIAVYPTMLPLFVQPANLDSKGVMSIRMGVPTVQEAVGVGQIAGVKISPSALPTIVVAQMLDATSYKPVQGGFLKLFPRSGKGPAYLTSKLSLNNGATGDLGMGIWFGTNTGKTEVQFQHASKSCVPWEAMIPGTAKDRTSLTLVKGWLFFVDARCK